MDFVKGNLNPKMYRENNIRGVKVYTVNCNPLEFPIPNFAYFYIRNYNVSQQYKPVADTLKSQMDVITRSYVFPGVLKFKGVEEFKNTIPQFYNGRFIIGYGAKGLCIVSDMKDALNWIDSFDMLETIVLYTPVNEYKLNPQEESQALLQSMAKVSLGVYKSDLVYVYLAFKDTITSRKRRTNEPESRRREYVSSTSTSTAATALTLTLTLPPSSLSSREIRSVEPRHIPKSKSTVDQIRQTDPP